MRTDVRRSLELGAATCDCIPANGITDGGYKPCFIPVARPGYVTSRAATSAARSRRRELAGQTAQVRRTRGSPISGRQVTPSGSVWAQSGGARANARPVPTAANLTSAIRDPSPGADW